MKRFYLGRLGINFNEGGYFLTFYWSRKLRMVRVWVRPCRWLSLSRRWKY